MTHGDDQREHPYWAQMSQNQANEHSRRIFHVSPWIEGGLDVTPADLWVMAQTVWGETRGAEFATRLAVAQLIRNRYEVHPEWQCRSLYWICTTPGHFAYWQLDRKPVASLREMEFGESLLACTQVCMGVYSNLIGAATHMYRETDARPSWAEGQEPVACVRPYFFFAGIA